MSWTYLLFVLFQLVQKQLFSNLKWHYKDTKRHRFLYNMTRWVVHSLSGLNVFPGYSKNNCLGVPGVILKNLKIPVFPSLCLLVGIRFEGGSIFERLLILKIVELITLRKLAGAKLPINIRWWKKAISD